MPTMFAAKYNSSNKINLRCLPTLTLVRLSQLDLTATGNSSSMGAPLFSLRAACACTRTWRHRWVATVWRTACSALEHQPEVALLALLAVSVAPPETTADRFPRALLRQYSSPTVVFLGLTHACRNLSRRYATNKTNGGDFHSGWCEFMLSKISRHECRWKKFSAYTSTFNP